MATGTLKRSESNADPTIKPASEEFQSLEGKKILVTGGTTGIGRATAIRLMMEGADVMIFGRHKQELDDALADLEKTGSGSCCGITADQAETEDVQRVFKEFEKQVGDLDILINNAAIAASTITEKSLDEISYAIRSNITGPIQCAKLAMERFKKNGHGQIVNVGSLSDTAREEGSDIYVATKSAMSGFSESLRKSANKKGVRVILIEPGAVGTDMVEDSSKEQRKKIKDEEMLKSEDIAESIVFALKQPKRCDIVLMQVRPHMQDQI